MRTRVGYAGGTKRAPTYHDLGDHTEAIEIDFDPSVISYEQLLDVFWASHEPCSRSFSRQYASLVLTHDEKQARAARDDARRIAGERGSEVETEIRPLDQFYRAEDYHQKWNLRRSGVIESEFLGLYPDPNDFTDSTAVMRANAFLGGHGSRAELERQIDDLGLSSSARDELSRR